MNVQSILKSSDYPVKIHRNVDHVYIDEHKKVLFFKDEPHFKNHSLSYSSSLSYFDDIVFSVVDL